MRLHCRQNTAGSWRDVDVCCVCSWQLPPGVSICSAPELQPPKNNTSEERGASEIINASQSEKHASQVTQKQQEGAKGGQEEWYL